MVITALIENTVCENGVGLGAEHGLSLHIKTATQTILFDAGKSSLFAANAEKLGIALNDVDFGILSHGHYDHGGGLRTFFGINKTAPFYLKKDAFLHQSAKIAGPIKKYIGIDKRLAAEQRSRFRFVDGLSEVATGVYIISDIIITHPKPAGNSILFKKTGNVIVPDDFNHELVFVIREERGLVVFTGCSHNGILNMVETVEDSFPDEAILAVIGGFHLMNPRTKAMAESEQTVTDLGLSLRAKKNLGKVYTGHCTGKAAYKVLKDAMGDKLDYFASGTKITI
jgi:7,8-dihydropterin-6-yl-methyl-4-(beta-D-ribofuranosyl)aminobenzene 5'-phosphate synthase